ncbi:DUF4350 domain-containing protein [Thermococcus sp. SY098]|uniref:DUF4350 domain-containing protein n=1 Tax=Thermococcus sp. SY098 TaxID=3111325 RepID=UPI002D7717F2|nr:DUF4350 domain-containing protein [Thermococcus sp. SY098]WRS52559.1 DUF4350 domain-containing protein [Thermococcus sp. SY098]
MKRWSLFLIIVMILSIVPVSTIGFVNAATYVPIPEIQGYSSSSPYVGQTVITTGVVTAVASKGFFIQNGTGPWTGIYVYLGSTPSVQIGDLVEVRGYVKEYYGLTEISVNPKYGDYVKVLGTAPVPEPVTLPSGNVSQEQWESVLVKVVGVTVVDPDLGYGEWLVDDGSGPVRIDDLIYRYTPEYGQKFDYIIGPVYYSYGNFKIEPRGPEDLKEYIPEIKIAELNVDRSLVKGVPAPISVLIKNDGIFSENVTLLIYANDEILLNTSLILDPGMNYSTTITWTPSSTGDAVIRAEIVGYDEKYVPVTVYENPQTVAFTIVTYYHYRYEKYWTILSPLYEQFDALITELQQYNVDLGPLQDEIEKIESNMQQINEEYSKYESLKIYTRNGYYLPLMPHIRKAALLSRETISMINDVLPLLNSTLEQVKAMIQQQQNVTGGNETTVQNVTVTVPKLVKVLIDSGHNQYYNDEKMSSLINKIEEELGWKVEINRGTLTSEKLQEYNILIITNPRTDITDEEAQAIKEFVKNGGGLLILGDWYKYVNTKSLNKVVEEFGIRFNKDELMDNDRNTGRPYFPLVGEFNFEHPATKFLNETSELYYNGDTLDVSGDVVWLIRGYDSSYAVDPTGKVTKEKGSKPIVAAAVEVGEGRIVAYGSSKAISDDYYGRYITTNWPFIKGVLLWLAGEI